MSGRILGWLAGGMPRGNDVPGRGWVGTDCGAIESPGVMVAVGGSRNCSTVGPPWAAGGMAGAATGGAPRNAEDVAGGQTGSGG